jgi:hypothetical protein
MSIQRGAAGSAFVAVVAQHTEAGDGGQRRGKGDQVRPGHRGAAQAADAAQVLVGAAAQLRTGAARVREDRARQVAREAADVVQADLLQVRLGQVAALEGHALQPRAGQRRAADRLVADARVLDAEGELVDVDRTRRDVRRQARGERLPHPPSSSPRRTR